MDEPNQFTMVIEQDGDWFIGLCPEVPGANGQGRTHEEALQSLRAAIALVLESTIVEKPLRGLSTSPSPGDRPAR